MNKVFIAFLMLIAISANAKNGDLIIKLNKNINPKHFELLVRGHDSELISKSQNIHLIKTNKLDSNSRSNILLELRSYPGVKYVQFDHDVKLRDTTTKAIIPSDTDFSKQWNLNPLNKSANNFSINVDTAWGAFGVGGKDISNNEIVIAIVDGGADLKHKDLIENLWVNKNEIPGNNIDDDKNGYIDDIVGWNAYSKSGNVSSNYHGTHVAGIAGAKGGNNLQVSGVNWNVKLMIVNGSSGSTSTVLEAYNYVLAQKKLWLSSGGKLGANVVATNSSFGIDNADCKSGDYPAWNDIYNEMGKAGILSAAATANNDVNIDNVGDVPTGCSSPYLITVTNTNKFGKRAFAGYGLKTIQIAAPGEKILSTLPGNTVGELSGTSMATPHIAGAVGYLHSVASQDFNNYIISKPGDGAIELKNIILSTVTKVDNLKTEVSSGGILNLYEASKVLNSYISNKKN